LDINERLAADAVKTVSIQTELNMMKVNPGLGTFYTIWPGNYLDYFAGPAACTGVQMLV